VALSTSDGAIEVHDLKGDLALHTSDGSITGENLDGTLAAGTSDGSIRVSGRFDRLDLGTSDGRIDAAAGAGSSADAGWTLHTSDGPLRLRLPPDIKANIEAQSGDGGISVQLPIEVSGQWSRHRLSGTLNGGGAPLRLRTGDGSIRIERF
jgi:DUF4097 and DUF4098 domain-containing protein YvlB